MPTYEYDCARCGRIEIFQSMKEEALTACPQCRSKRFARCISGGAGLIFKGSGFYETDYNRSSDYQSKAKGDAESSAPAAEAGKDSASKDAAAPSSAPAADQPASTANSDTKTGKGGTGSAAAS